MAAAGVDARVLAAELREAIAVHHQRVLEQGAACPFDLHRLLPVPDDVLRLGPDDPVSQRWLWEHWGTLWPLRHVRRIDAADRRLRRSAARPTSLLGRLDPLARPGPAACRLAGAGAGCPAGSTARMAAIA